MSQGLLTFTQSWKFRRFCVNRSRLSSSMSAVSSLVPARFLTIIAHLVIVITIFWSRVSEMVYFLFCADQCLTIKFALLCFVNRRTTCGPVYLWILRKSNMTAKIESKGTFSNAVAKTSYCPSCNPCLFF